MTKQIDPSKYWFAVGFDNGADGKRKRSQNKDYLRGYSAGLHYREVRQGVPYEKLTPKYSLRKRNAITGKAFTFHGSFTSLILARKKEKSVPGSFIQEKDGRYYVLKPKRIATSVRNSPKGAAKIYGRCLRIEAIKLQKHTYGGKVTPPGQKYFHDFSTKYAVIYGLPDGSLLIKA